jgi:hypothetical protein
MKTRLAVLLATALAACSSGGGGDKAPTSDEPNDTIAQATALTPGTPIIATISAESDSDFYKFTVPAGGGNVRFQTFDEGGVTCDPNHGAVDPFIEVYDAASTFLAANDDGGVLPFCEDLTVALPAGTSYVKVGGWPPVPFNYLLKVTIQ